MEKAAGRKWAEAWRAGAGRGPRKGLSRGTGGWQGKPVGTLPELRVRAPGEVRGDTSTARLVQETLADVLWAGHREAVHLPMQPHNRCVRAAPFYRAERVEVWVLQLLSVRP